MQRTFWLVIFSLLLVSCQPQESAIITVLDNLNVHRLQTGEHIPRNILTQANISIAPADRVYVNGIPVSQDQPITSQPPFILQIRRALPVTLLTPDGRQVITTAASTVGQALFEAGLSLHAKDEIIPPANTPISGALTVTYRPARQITVMTNNGALLIRSAAETTGVALAEAGIPLQNLDFSLPREADALPANGQVQVIQVNEAVQLAQQSLPFESEFIVSADVELDQQQILQPGRPGLIVSRTRIRYEDGQEISRLAEAETLVREPESRVVGYGTQVVVRTAVVDGVGIEYWRALQMYATSYSPCRSGADRCFSGTSSGKPVQKGVVAMTRANYLSMHGQPLYIPGYGYATVEDVGGGIPGTLWVDLGYSDANWQQWSEWVTVYFLTPVPANIIYILDT